MGEPKLLPCPFCGNDVAERMTWDDARVSGFIRHSIDCPKGVGGCGALTAWHETARGAIEAWNRRAQPAQEIRALRTENARLRAQVEGEDERTPRCHTCGNVATCFGSYEMHSPAFACDTCCGHGNEDGWCLTLSELGEAYAALLHTKGGRDDD